MVSMELEAVGQRPRSQLSTNVMEALDADFDEGSAWLFLVTNHSARPKLLDAVSLQTVEFCPKCFFYLRKNAKKTKTNAETICSGPMGVEYEILDGNGCLHMGMGQYL